MTLLALFCAAVAAALAVPAPRRPVPARARSPQVPGWLRPRAGALPSRTRWVLGGCLGLVAYLLIEPS
ncbi:MAG: hypothetical protein Q4F67_10705, partial [Propionibacteriaceae bacterium]|nr:hypothetical protein [Propionibacteriaceae bacterium]